MYCHCLAYRSLLHYIGKGSANQSRAYATMELTVYGQSGPNGQIIQDIDIDNILIWASRRLARVNRPKVIRITDCESTCRASNRQAREGGND